MSREEAEVALDLALGRLFKLCSRPEQPGDIEQYEKLRAVAMEAAEVLGIDSTPGYRPDIRRERRD